MSAGTYNITAEQTAAWYPVPWVLVQPGRRMKRTAVFLAAALAAVFISGCAGHSNLQSGARVPVPAEWAAYCARHPEREECRL